MTERRIANQPVPAVEPRIVLLPLGSCEQHGRHLPFGTDHRISERFTEAVLNRWGDAHGLASLPGVPYGVSIEHAWCAGTVTVPTRVYIDLVAALCDSIALSLRPGAIVLVNGHGGNLGALDSVIREISMATGVFTCVVNPLALARVDLPSPVPDIHAAAAETSVLLHICPSSVGEVPHGDDSAATAANIRSTVTNRDVLWPWHTRDDGIARDGVVGSLDGATSQLGERIWNSAVDRMGEVLDRITARLQRTDPCDATLPPGEVSPRRTDANLDDAVVRRFLRCPLDRGEFDTVAAANVLTRLRCQSCGTSYEVRDGIPLLVLETSEPEKTAE